MIGADKLTPHTLRHLFTQAVPAPLRTEAVRSAPIGRRSRNLTPPASKLADRLPSRSSGSTRASPCIGVAPVARICRHRVTHGAGNLDLQQERARLRQCCT